MTKFAIFYADIARERTALRLRFPDGNVLVSSRGNTCETNIEIAARLLTEKTHTLATDAEANAYRAAMEMNRTRSAPVASLESARIQFKALITGRDQK